MLYLIFFFWGGGVLCCLPYLLNVHGNPSTLPSPRPLAFMLIGVAFAVEDSTGRLCGALIAVWFTVGLFARIDPL